MSRYDWENLVRQLAIHNMEIGPADAAASTRTGVRQAGDRIGQFLVDQRPADFVQTMPNIAGSPNCPRVNAP